MKLLEIARDPRALATLNDAEARCDYVYTYPPRQAYMPLPPAIDPQSVIAEDLRVDPRVNLYVHFPFCQQICSFCNLYATKVGLDQNFDEYADLLEMEIARRGIVSPSVQVRTVYFGGGTPSLLPPELHDRVLAQLERVFSFARADISEVAIEVSPESASPIRMAELRSVGFTRVNLGLQSTTSTGLLSIGRKYDAGKNVDALDAAMAADFPNVCADLIYGLPGQSDAEWVDAIEWAVSRAIPTVCAYPLSVRSGTRYNGLEVSGPTLYRRYDIADEILRSAGYEQETHVRWSLPGRGGYLQKQYHWDCENLLGFGAGARTYVRSFDFRNGYSLRPRRAALDNYRTRILGGLDPATHGRPISTGERQRKAVILGLRSLNRRDFVEKHGVDPIDAFPVEFELLEKAGHIEITPHDISLTRAGTRHRDVGAQLFFSDAVRADVLGYRYDD